MPTRTKNHEETIAALVTELAQVELEFEAAEKAYDAQFEEVQKLLEPFKTERDAQATRRAELREQIKAEGLLVEKDKLHPALQVKEMTDIQYDKAAMFQWCVTFNPSLLELRDSNISQHVNWILGSKSQTKKYFGLDGSKPVVPMPVTVEKVPQVQIATNLSKYLPIAKSEPEAQADPEPQEPPTVKAEPDADATEKIVPVEPKADAATLANAQNAADWKAKIGQSQTEE